MKAKRKKFKTWQADTVNKYQESDAFIHSYVHLVKSNWVFSIYRLTILNSKDTVISSVSDN